MKRVLFALLSVIIVVCIIGAFIAAGFGIVWFFHTYPAAFPYVFFSLIFAYIFSMAYEATNQDVTFKSYFGLN